MKQNQAKRTLSAINRLNIERAATLARKLRDAAWAAGHDDYTALMLLAEDSISNPDQWERTIVSAQKMGVYVSIDR